jgi:ribosomal protein S18 acetylase RimI-like enzyme
MDTQPFAMPTAGSDAWASRFRDSIRPARQADLPALASIHVDSGTPGLLTDLGTHFLERVYYRGLLDSPLASIDVVEMGRCPVGFVAFSPDSDRLFVQAIGRRWYLAGWLILRAGLRRPRVMGDLFETVLAVRRHGLDKGIKAEVVSLQVDVRYQGLGLGLILLQRALHRLQDRGIEQVKSRTLVSNTAVERLYLYFGFRAVGTFRLQRRVWHMMVWYKGMVAGDEPDGKA